MKNTFNTKKHQKTLEEFNMTTFFLENLEKHISPISEERLQSYLDISEHDYETAICLYTEFQNISKLYFHIIQEIEVALRNKIIQYLTEYIEKIDPNFQQDFFHHAIFTSNISPKNLSKLQDVLKDTLKREMNKYSKVQRKLASKNKSTSHLVQPTLNSLQIHQIISEFSFGFWYNLFNIKYKNLNNICFSNNQQIFDGKFASGNDLYTQLNSVGAFRNRLFHHEPVWKNANINTPEKALSNLKQKYHNFSITLEKLSPERHELITKRYTKEYLDNVFCINRFNKRIADSLYLLLNKNKDKKLLSNFQLYTLQELILGKKVVIPPSPITKLSIEYKNELQHFHLKHVYLYETPENINLCGITARNFIILYGSSSGQNGQITQICITANHKCSRSLVLLRNTIY